MLILVPAAWICTPQNAKFSLLGTSGIWTVLLGFLVVGFCGFFVWFGVGFFYYYFYFVVLVWFCFGFFVFGSFFGLVWFGFFVSLYWGEGFLFIFVFVWWWLLSDHDEVEDFALAIIHLQPLGAKISPRLGLFWFSLFIFCVFIWFCPSGSSSNENASPTCLSLQKSLPTSSFSSWSLPGPAQAPWAQSLPRFYFKPELSETALENPKTPWRTRFQTLQK